MTLDALVILAGAMTVIVPFLGLPQRWHQALLFIIGVCTIFLGIIVRRRLSQKAPPRAGDVYEKI